MAADAAGWGKQLPKGHGLGIAVHRSFLSYVATVVEVAVDDQGKIRIPRVDTAIDCGFAANPERIRSQIEGAAVMGTTLALYSGVTFKNGAAVEGNFDTYPMARIDIAPLDVRTHIVPHGFDTPASGVGEPGVPPFAPALCQRDLRGDGQAAPRAAVRGHAQGVRRRPQGSASRHGRGSSARGDPGLVSGVGCAGPRLLYKP